MSPKSVREVKVDNMTRLVNRYDTDFWGVTGHVISFQNQAASETMIVTSSHTWSFDWSAQATLRESTGKVPARQDITCGDHHSVWLHHRTSTNHRELGMWSCVLLEEEPGHRTQIIELYRVDNNQTNELGLAYMPSKQEVHSAAQPQHNAQQPNY